jgi:hypothetical protein
VAGVGDRTAYTALKDKATVTLATGVAAFSGSKSDFPLYTMSKSGNDATYTDNAFTAGNVTLTTTATPVAYTIIAPIDVVANGDKLVFDIATVNGSATAEVDLSGQYTGNTAGRAFSITFTFDDLDDKILATASVAEWLFSGSVNVPVD